MIRWIPKASSATEIPHEVLFEAQKDVESRPSVAARLHMLDGAERKALDAAVLTARPAIAAGARSELDALAAHASRFHAAVRDLAESASWPGIESLSTLETRIEQAEHIKRAKIAAEAESRSGANACRDKWHQAQLAVADKPGWLAKRACTRARRSYEASLKANMADKKSLMEVITAQKRLELTHTKALSDVERRFEGYPQIRESRMLAFNALHAAVHAVATGMFDAYRDALAALAIGSPPPVASAIRIHGEHRATTGSDFDVFVSHASEDKVDVARPLTRELQARQLAVWLDEQELVLGDSLSQKIDDGLARSRFGIVVLSEDFFKKQWTRRELDGLVARETLHGEKVILPIWHGLTREQVFRYSPTLASRLAASTTDGLDVVADAVMRALRR